MKLLALAAVAALFAVPALADPAPKPPPIDPKVQQLSVDLTKTQFLLAQYRQRVADLEDTIAQERANEAIGAAVAKAQAEKPAPAKAAPH